MGGSLTYYQSPAKYEIGKAHGVLFLLCPGEKDSKGMLIMRLFYFMDKLRIMVAIWKWIIWNARKNDTLSSQISITKSEKVSLDVSS